MLRRAGSNWSGVVGVAVDDLPLTVLAAVEVGGAQGPDADWPVACLSGCHLAAVRVKGAARPFGMACGHP
jgi:hypothetical protein